MCGDTGSDYSDWVSSDELANIDTELGNYDVDLNTITDGATTVADTGGDASLNFDWNTGETYTDGAATLSGDTNGYDWLSNEQYPTDTGSQTLQAQSGEDFYDDASARVGATDRDSFVNSVTSKADDKSFLDKTSDFLNDKKNNELLKLGIGGAKGLYDGYAANQKEKKEYEKMLEQRAYNERIQREKEERAAARGGGGGGSSALELLAAKDALEQAQNARYSASITGLKKPGLINGGRRLTYVGGKPVYTDDGKLN